MSWIIVGTMAVTGTVSAFGADRKIGRQIDDLDAKEDAYRAQAIQNRNAFETRYSQTENMHSGQIEALKKQKTFNVGKVASSVGGSGAQAGSGTTAHIVASEAARNQFAIDSYTKKADYELENIREKGKNEQTRFNNMASEVADQSNYLNKNRQMMVFESFFGGAVGGVGAGATFQSAYGKP
tara:strand:- start:600 stop:1145 length:546 start_codon:yes stop_codon:yes gene_type:complete